MRPIAGRIFYDSYSTGCGRFGCIPSRFQRQRRHGDADFRQDADGQEAGARLSYAISEAGEIALSLDAVSEYRDEFGALRGRAAAELRLGDTDGLGIDLSIAYEGIGVDDYESLSGRVGFTAALN